MSLLTHSSVLAWRIPGMGEPAGLLSMGSHSVGHDWSDLAAAAVYIYVNPNLPIHPTLLPLLVSIYLFSVSVYFCFANNFICIIFLDSTYKQYYMIFVFLFLTYFTLCDKLYVPLHLCKWYSFIPFDGWVIFHCICSTFSLSISLLMDI